MAIIEKTINGVKMKASDRDNIVFWMSDWGQWTELVKLNKGLYVKDYGNRGNYGHITLALTAE